MFIWRWIKRLVNWYAEDHKFKKRMKELQKRDPFIYK